MHGSENLQRFMLFVFLCDTLMMVAEATETCRRTW